MADFIQAISGFFENILSFFDNIFHNILSFFAGITLLVNPFITQFIGASTLLPFFLVPFITLGFTILIVKLLLDLL